MAYVLYCAAALLAFLNRAVWIVYPASLPDTNSLAATTSGLHGNCDSLIFKESLSVRGVSNLQHAAAIVEKEDRPVVFRKFFEDPEGLWAELYETYRSEKLKQPRVEIKSFGNMFMAGTRTHSMDAFDITLQDILEPTGNITYYASFARFLTKKSIEDILGTIPDSFITDTNFISNFEQDVIASPIHSTTFVTSYSAQLKGRKLWIWVPPSRMEEDIGILSTASANFHHRGSEASYLDAAGEMYVSVVDAGDLLVFPPLWGHSVLTQAGPNVMLNLRQRNLQYSALRYPMRFIETVLSVAALYQPGGHSTAKFNRVQQQMYEQREKRYEDDPKWVPPETSCKKNLKRLLYREELS